MATRSTHPSDPPPVRLSRSELSRVAGRHLADLADHERRTEAERGVTWFMRTRRLGRAIALGWLSIVETVGGASRWLLSPRRVTGRLVRRPLLWHPGKTFSLWTAMLAAFATAGYVVAFVRFQGKGSEEDVRGILAGIAGAATLALLFLLWNDLFRLPHLAGRIRHRVAKHPECILLTNLLAQRARPLVEHAALEIVPRTELYDDLLPGALARGRKDVQVIVGDAGAGKTTALLAVAELLARNGIVSVLVPLLSEQETALIEPAEARFKRQVGELARSGAEADLLWRWLVLRRRVAVLVDDIDQVGPDGERGLVMRKMLDEAEESGLPVIATARPAGVPAGIAASAIDLGALEEREAVDHVIRRAKAEPSFSHSSQPSRRRIAEWVAEGKLAEAPFYLDLLASLAAVGQCPRLPLAGSMSGSSQDAGRVYRTPDGDWVWNSLWVRFRLLEHFYEQTELGRVRRSLGIEPRERRSTLRALEDAALGTLVANSLSARMKLQPRDISEPTSRQTQPLRRQIADFIDTDDRSGLQATGDGGEHERSGSERINVSAHEVIDAGERLMILELRAREGEIAFRHRIMQAYLAGRRLAIREHDADRGGESADPRISNPTDRVPREQRDWVAALLDPAHPEKLTALMALTFATMRAREIAEAQANVHREGEGEEGRHRRARTWDAIGQRIVFSLVSEARRVRMSPPDDPRAGGRSRTQVTLSEELGDERASVELAVSMDRGDGVPASEAARLDPLNKPNPEHRSDPDDALLKLATAAEIARAVPRTVDASHPAAPQVASVERERADGEAPEEVGGIVDEIQCTPGATRWTLLRAIDALAVPSSTRGGEAFDEVRGAQRWERIWEFARNRDYEVKRAASEALEQNAYEAFKALAEKIESLIDRAAARSAYGRWLVRPEQANGSIDGALALRAPLALLTGAADDLPELDIREWKRDEHIRALEALGAVLPAIVSGFREDPSIALESAVRGPSRNGRPPATTAAGMAEDDRGAPAATAAEMAKDDRGAETEAEATTCHPVHIRSDRLDYARRARRALNSLVALAFEGTHGDLESAVAQGFRSDALRHARHPERMATGPGWVTPNRALVAGVCLDYASFWYARLALYQALALYAIAGADTQETFDVFARHISRGGRDRHPFTQRAARLARAAVRRHELHSERWIAFLWGDEGKDCGKRARQLSAGTARLLADVTVLLNLNESSPEDRQDAFAQMQTLPFCLSASRDRSEILGEGCPSHCGWGLCPYRQPPPDEPDAHRGVRRSFCRQQRQLARRRPAWQRAISARRLREFWRAMEMRARS